ncbi:hypothetical protein V2J09_023502 [Rumex salicifolius]
MEIPGRQSRLELYKSSLCLAYQSLGIVYGDLSTSPIYVYKSTFSGELQLYEEDYEILGVLSLVFWTLTLIPLFKYVVFVLSADDNGEGGTFALYSLLCRHTRIGLINASNGGNEQRVTEANSKETKTSLIIREFFETHRSSRVVLLLVVLLGTSMVISDGILTPAISVLSAVYGIRIKAPHLHENYTIFCACTILVVLFFLQHYGTRRVGFLFAPILVAWLLCIAGVGIYNIIHWNPSVIHAISPMYIYNFFKVTGKVGWSSLGGVFLCVTGAEAMFADLGHFSTLAIRIAFSGFVYPCLVLAYMGEAAYLSKHREDLQSSFYKAIPEQVFWPTFIIATLATIVASQAVISATFSIVSQCRALKCMPRVKLVHTSTDIHGQIYIPEVNWILMILCLAVVLGFKDTNKIANAYALAVITVMFVTTCLMFLIITTVWKKNVILALVFVAFFGFIELAYLSACVGTVHKGGWVPLTSSLLALFLMSVWKYGTVEKHAFEVQNKVSLDSFLNLTPGLGIVRVPGIGLVYSNVLSGVPSTFAHFITNFPAFHEVLIFITIETIMFLLPNDSISPELALLISTYFAALYGYKDAKDTYKFESHLINKVAEFLQQETHKDDIIITVSNHHFLSESLATENEVVQEPSSSGDQTGRRVSFKESWESSEEVKKLMVARRSGISYMMGNVYVMASDTSPCLKKMAIIVYGFLRQNCRRPSIALGIPHTSLIEVGMVQIAGEAAEFLVGKRKASEKMTDEKVDEDDKTRRR